mmetsp:Transcript_16470/g.35607  ORF Transcript_16470/g.35607 Transcript_16470/m.35607 type:complete len:214 (+) Transcript_16470:89-730(+)
MAFYDRSFLSSLNFLSTWSMSPFMVCEVQYCSILGMAWQLVHTLSLALDLLILLHELEFFVNSTQAVEMHGDPAIHMRLWGVAHQCAIRQVGESGPSPVWRAATHSRTKIIENHLGNLVDPRIMRPLDHSISHHAVVHIVVLVCRIPLVEYERVEDCLVELAISALHIQLVPKPLYPEVHESKRGGVRVGQPHPAVGVPMPPIHLECHICVKP